MNPSPTTSQPAATTPQHSPAPRTIGRFTLLREHRRGHAGVVYQAEETLASGMKRPVAVKILRSPNLADPRYIDKFEREARAMLEFGAHPHIVGIVECGRLGPGEFWIAMDWLPACLQDRIGENPAPERDVARMIRHVARGLHHLHTFESRPVLHRDIKPKNILVTGEGEHATYRIADLELAGRNDPNLPCSAESVRFMAPEFCRTDAARESPASDIYSLGFVAYSMLLGSRLFAEQFPELTDDAAADRDGSVGGWMQWHISPNLEAAPVRELIESVSPQLSDIVRKMMAKPLDERFQSAQEVLDALGASGEEEGIQLIPGDTTPVRWIARATRHSKLIALSGLALAAVACGAWVQLRPRPFLNLPDGPAHFFQGPAGELRVRAGNAPPDATVEVEFEGGTVTLHPSIERTTNAETRGFNGSVELSTPKTVSGLIRLLSSEGRLLATTEAVFTREPPVQVSVKTEPARPAFPLAIAFADGTTQTVRADSEGRIAFEADPQILSLTGQDSRFVLASESAALRVTPGEQQSGAVKLLSRFGSLRVSVKPADARVTIERAGSEPEDIALSDGVATIEREIGDWTLRASKDGFQPARRSVEVSRLDVRSADLQLAQLPPPPAAAAPPPPPLDAIEREVRTLAPLAQLETTQVPIAGKVRVSGVVLNQQELELLTKRLEPVAGELLWEVRVDPDALGRIMTAGLLEAGLEAPDVRVIDGGQRLWAWLRPKDSHDEFMARKLMSTYFLSDGRVSVRIGR